MSKPKLAWKYSRGEWEEIVDPLEWNDGEYFKDVLTRGGYYSHASFKWGHEYDDVGCEFYARNDGERYPVMLSVCLSGDSIETVYIYDFPSLMMFSKEYTAPFVMGALGSYAEETDKLLRRAFRAWHGHEPTSVCWVCDPEEHQLRQEMKQKRTKPPDRTAE